MDTLVEACGWLMVACVFVAIVESIVQTLDERGWGRDNKDE